MIKTLFLILILVCLGYLALCLFLFLQQRSVLYYPHPPSRTGDADAVWLENENQRLKIWQVRKEVGPALIYFGGYAEEVSLSLSDFKRLAPGYSLYLMNYRGYGGSSGSPTQNGLYADSLALYDRVAAGHTAIVVVGRSLGSGIAVYLAAQRPVRAAVLITPYSSMVDLAKHHYPYVPVNSLMKDRFESIRFAPDIAVPVLNLIAERDEVIPRKISEGLVQAFPPGVAEKVIIMDTQHNTIESNPDYEQRLKTFLEKVAGKGSQR